MLRILAPEKKYTKLTKFNSRKVANYKLHRQAMPRILISIPESESRQLLVGSDSNSDSGLVTTAPGDSGSGSDSDPATLLKTLRRDAHARALSSYT